MAADPERMRSYLQDKGWECLTPDGEVREIWALTARGERYEVMRPFSKQYADYALRVSDLLRTLSTVEDRSELAIWSDLASV